MSDWVRYGEVYEPEAAVERLRMPFKGRQPPTNHTCPFPGCTEPPDAKTKLRAQLGSQMLLVEVEVCQAHKRMNEAESE